MLSWHGRWSSALTGTELELQLRVPWFASLSLTPAPAATTALSLALC